MSERMILCLLVVLFASFGVQADVIHYSATLEPDIANESVKGSVMIRVRTTSNVIATFIAAAYLEHRFGREVYLREIETYRANYEKVRTAGKDKPLVFPDWLNPTREDRILVYDKGGLRSPSAARRDG